MTTWGLSGPIWGLSGAYLGPSGSCLEPVWAHLGLVWAQLGSPWLHLGPILADLGHCVWLGRLHRGRWRDSGCMHPSRQILISWSPVDKSQSTKKSYPAPWMHPPPPQSTKRKKINFPSTGNIVIMSTHEFSSLETRPNLFFRS